MGKIHISCPSGEISEIIGYGLSAPDTLIMDACMPNSDSNECMHLINETAVNSTIQG